MTTTSLAEDYAVNKGLTPEQCAYMRDELAKEFPHLSVTVEMRDGHLHVAALPTEGAIPTSAAARQPRQGAGA